MSTDGHHVLPMKIYINVFVALLFLTAITVLVAQFDFGSMNAFIAMAVATVKATLVAMYFMHLKYDEKSNTACLVGAFFFLIVMFAFIALDAGSRVVELNTL
ncbi:MAG: cytochrome C oxidase subunit IV family protein [Bdellovibrionales bacterium]